MEALLPILFAALVGMGHAFEADHLIAVSNIVSKRDSMVLAVKDGFYWGLGHTTTIVVIGSVIILSRATFLNSGYFEAGVGVMLIVMGISRLTNKNNFSKTRIPRYQHSFAYTIGLVHGLAGSGALVLLVMSEISDPMLGITYLFVFGIGSIIGMFIAAGLFSIPFTQRMKINKSVRAGIVVVSSLICILYGSWMIYENMVL
ncbi:urease accessory protein [Pontibacter sp. SGAir0037]|uniref:urease accessory protein n=1 Tax=Pontibacter sp. SGAir0037 TaxID=2571030 RepID=UPI0010CCDE6B|nr:urease accessory protein [Pontibacter sp. SGAir0037]QCR23197.1 urease accessory protein [Pontibacter sp. SGAir0037]